MNVTLIAEGSSMEDRKQENWGVSFLVGENLLFDTFGKSSVLLSNAQKYAVDLSRLKRIVISHDDWDHVSGLWAVLQDNAGIDVHVCPHTAPEVKEKIVSLGGRLIESRGFSEIENNIYLTGEMKTGPGGRTIYEQSLVMRTMKGISVLTGCAHPGIIRIIDEVKKHFGETVYAVIGGLHLKDSSEADIRKTVAQLKSFPINKIVPLHCTGAAAVAILEKEFNGRFIKLDPGAGVEV